MAKAYLTLIFVITLLIELNHAIDLWNISELKNEGFIPSKENRLEKRDAEQVGSFDEGSGDEDDKVIPILKNITEKNLNGTDLRELSEDMLDEKENLENLNTLVLDNNAIEAIDTEVFINFLNLKHLSMKDNKLSSLDTETFTDLAKLTELNLDKNPLELPENSHFLTIISLRNLTMSECKLTSIPENTFDGMTGLELLDIGRNPISETTPITKGLFEPLSNLSTLILPSSASDDLMKEVCKSHALLQKICVDMCDSSKDHSCSEQSPPNTEEPSNPLLKTTIAEEGIAGIKKISDEVHETLVKVAVSGVEAMRKVSDEATNTGDVIKETVAKAIDKLPGLVRQMPGMSEKAPEPPVLVTETPNKLPGLVRQMPEMSEKAPEPPVLVTETPNKLPGLVRQMPEMSEKAPEPPVLVTETPNKLPGLVRQMPEMSEKAPEPPVLVTETPNKLPEATPDISDKEPDILTTSVFKAKPNDQGDSQTGGDILASSKSGVTSQGINGPAIGIIVGIIILAVVGIVLKKNWSKIKGKWDSNSTPQARQNADIPRVRQPEEVPLKTNNDQNNPV
ncbi:uncharacterized protein LOC143914920 isoform X2 [Arctopsyche grandis]|uniref:uncharacterized protein LOC143914920 isoform X2 n=1 Tax=Arctopsyche grandis TaxID=121162 RepID=UPI00406D8221